MALSFRIKNLMEQSSWIRRMFEEGIHLKRQYGEENVIDLSLGNPVIEPPGKLLDALAKCIEDRSPGMHRYMPNAGFIETRSAVARSLSPECKIELDADDVVMTCGAAGALNITLKTLLNPGDEVLVLAPYFVEYVFYADNHGGKVRVVPTDKNFLPNLNTIQKAFSEKTKAIIINSPNNPTGVVYSRSILTGLAALLKEQSSRRNQTIYLISDDPYKKIVYDKVETPNVMEFYDNTIYITSHSKDLGVPGERIGFVTVHPRSEMAKEIMDGLIFCNRILGFVNAPALMQRVVMELQSVNVDVQNYKKNRDFLYRELTRIGYSIVKPEGAFYFFPKSPIKDEVGFCKILAEHKILAVPGRGFGQPGYFRISYCVPNDIIQRSVEGVELAFAKI